jgi:hypothetical protein
MATTTTITSTYAGEVAGGYFLEAFKEADALKNGIMEIYENVDNKLVLQKLQTTNGRREYSCGHVPAGSITIAEVNLIPKKFKDDWDICKETFRAKSWNPKAYGKSAHNDVFDKVVLDAIVANKLATEAEYLGEKIWTAEESTDGFDGLLTQFTDRADTINVVGDTVTKTNVLTELEKAIDAIPLALRKKNLTISVSSDVAQAYNFYLIEKGTVNGLGGNANTSLVFGKYSLVEDTGLPANTIIINEKGNIGFGTSALADHNEIKVVDEDSIGLLTGKVRGTMVYNLGLTYVYGAEIVWYSADHVAPSV